MRRYETMFIIDPNLETEAVNELVESFKGIIQNEGGQVDRVDEWGKRKLAYPIKKQKEGYYFLMEFTASPETAQELDRVFKITNGLLRYLIVKLDK